VTTCKGPPVPHSSSFLSHLPPMYIVHRLPGKHIITLLPSCKVATMATVKAPLKTQKPVPQASVFKRAVLFLVCSNPIPDPSSGPVSIWIKRLFSNPAVCSHLPLQKQGTQNLERALLVPPYLVFSRVCSITGRLGLFLFAHILASTKCHRNLHVSHLPERLTPHFRLRFTLL
jgi:hypothetical protein